MLGLFSIGSVFPRKQVPVIIYHSIDETGSCLSIRPSVFKKQMELIKEGGYRTLTATELVRDLEEKQDIPDNTVVITFDDGFENNYSVAFPLLSNLGLKATIFLATDYVGRRHTWDKEYGVPNLPLLTWDMINEMCKYGMDFQSHTATHPHLPMLPEEKIRDEIRRSRLTIENRLGRKCDILCYPYGEFDTCAIRILKEEGYVSAFACQPDRDDLYSKRRIGSGHLTTPLAFKAVLKGNFGIYQKMKKMARSRNS